MRDEYTFRLGRWSWRQFPLRERGTCATYHIGWLTIRVYRGGIEAYIDRQMIGREARMQERMVAARAELTKAAERLKGMGQ